MYSYERPSLVSNTLPLSSILISLLPLVLYLEYSYVENKLEALSPRAIKIEKKIFMVLNPKYFNSLSFNDLKSLKLIKIPIKINM